jgi:hypothetical protein
MPARRLHAGLATLGWLLLAAAVVPRADAAQAPRQILFIGNSFLFGAGSPVQAFRPATVTDLNGAGTGGVPSLVRMLLAESGRDDRVSLELHGGVGLDWHLAQRSAQIAAQPWDVVVMHGYSTLDIEHPGDPALLRATVQEMAQLLLAGNPRVDLRLMQTWPRADQVYPETGHWHGQSTDDMARDLRRAYDAAAAATPAVRGVIPVGDAFVRAMHEGVADANPYDGIEDGRIDLWGVDHYHASTAGYYLEALVIFGALTGEDPRTLGAGECAAAELAIAPAQRASLQRIAAAELLAQHLLPSPGAGAQPAQAPASSKKGSTSTGRPHSSASATMRSGATSTSLAPAETSCAKWS